MKTKHTPGPWAYHVAPHDGFGAETVQSVYGLVVSMPQPADTEGRANARLIAAAPALLDALEVILGAHDTKNNGAYMGEAVLCRQYAEKARAAIKAAKGEA